MEPFPDFYYDIRIDIGFILLTCGRLDVVIFGQLHLVLGLLEEVAESDVHIHNSMAYCVSIFCSLTQALPKIGHLYLTSISCW